VTFPGFLPPPFDVGGNALLERLELVVKLFRRHGRARLTDKPWRGGDGGLPRRLLRVGIQVGIRGRGGGLRHRFHLVQVDVDVLTPPRLVILQPGPPALQLLRPLADLLTERGVFLAVTVFDDIANVPAPGVHGADLVNDCFGLHGWSGSG